MVDSQITKKVPQVNCGLTCGAFSFVQIFGVGQVMNYKDYQNTRDAAWKILLDCGIEKLPVDLNHICRQLDVGVYRYGDVTVTGETRLRGDGLLYFEGNRPVILFDQDKPPARIRFTIAHELGHLILGHVAPGQQSTVNRELLTSADPIETAANRFAIRLLAPACVLWGMEAYTAQEISQLCNISLQAAQFRAERMLVLRSRGKFLNSALERQVYEQFLPFIREARQSPLDG